MGYELLDRKIKDKSTKIKVKLIVNGRVPNFL